MIARTITPRPDAGTVFRIVEAGGHLVAERFVPVADAEAIAEAAVELADVVGRYPPRACALFTFDARTGRRLPERGVDLTWEVPCP